MEDGDTTPSIVDVMDPVAQQAALEKITLVQQCSTAKVAKEELMKEFAVAVAERVTKIMAQKNKELVEAITKTNKELIETMTKKIEAAADRLAERVDRGLDELKAEIRAAGLRSASKNFPALPFTDDEPPKGFEENLHEELRNLLAVPKYHKIKLFVGEEDFTAMVLSMGTPERVLDRLKALGTTGSTSPKELLSEAAVQVETSPTLKLKLQGFVDGSATNDHFPFFVVKSDGFWLSPNPDGACTDLCMFIEFKLSEACNLFASLRRVLERLRGVMSMNAFLLRAVGFATDGLGAYQVVFTRKIIGLEFHEQVRITAIRPHEIERSWNAFYDQCITSPHRFFHEDTVLIAHALKEAFDDSPTIGYVKVDLHDHSSSRVWIVYGVEELQNGDLKRLSLRASFNKPLFVVKVNRDDSGRSEIEFDALSRLAHSPYFVLRGTNEDAKQLAHYRTFNDEHSSVADALVEHFPVLFAIKLAKDAKEIESVHFKKKSGDTAIPAATRVCLKKYTEKITQSMCWADITLPSSHLHQSLAGGGGSAVVMRIGLPLDFGGKIDLTPQMQRLIITAVSRWERLYMKAGIFHSDVRPPNVLWFPRTPIDDALKGVAIPPPEDKDAMAIVEKAMGALSLSCSDQAKEQLKREIVSVRELVPVLLDFDLAQFLPNPPSFFDGSLDASVWNLPDTICSGNDGDRFDRLKDIYDQEQDQSIAPLQRVKWSEAYEKIMIERLFQ